MFDLRYHVASLAAVFLALIIGIVVGVGISGKGFVSDSERSLFNAQIADLKSRLDSATARGADLARAQRAAQTFVSDAYPALMGRRMAGKRVALVFAGHEDGRIGSLVEQALGDAGGQPPLRTLGTRSPASTPVALLRPAPRSDPGLGRQRQAPSTAARRTRCGERPRAPACGVLERGVGVLPAREVQREGRLGDVGRASPLRNRRWASESVDAR